MLSCLECVNKKLEGLTIENIWADIGGTPSLILEGIIFTDQMLPETEVEQGNFPSSLVQHHVSQLDVSMNDVFLQTEQVRLVSVKAKCPNHPSHSYARHGGVSHTNSDMTP